MTAWSSDHFLSRNFILPTTAVIHAVQNFKAISLKEMDSVKLMDRFDTKFVFLIDQLPALLEQLTQNYYILQINGVRMFNYTSTYYDTLGYKMFHDHHNQKLNRFKVRKREYLHTGQVFFEIKYKSNKGQTRKKRMVSSNRNCKFCKEEKKFLRKVTPFRVKMLHPSLTNQFSRVTLVHKQKAERVTIDLNLNYEYAGKTAEFPPLTVAEIKQGRSSGVSDLERLFKENHILPMSFSKYCMGIVMLNPQIKYNRFKINFLKLQKLSNNTGYAAINY